MEEQGATLAEQALRSLYDVVRVLADADLLDIDMLAEVDPATAEALAAAIQGAESVLVETFGPQAVK